MGMIVCPGQKGLWEGSPILGRGDCGNDSCPGGGACGKNSSNLSRGGLWEGIPH